MCWRLDCTANSNLVMSVTQSFTHCLVHAYALINRYEHINLLSNTFGYVAEGCSLSLKEVYVY